MKFINFLELTNELQGANYTIEDLIAFANNGFKLLQRGGVVLLVIALGLGFLIYGLTDVDNKPRAKQKIIQVVFGLVGLVLASSIVTIILSLFK